MTAPLILLAFVVLVVTLVPRLMVGARWVAQSPSVAVVVWQSATIAATLGLLLTGVALSLPVLPVDSQLMHLVRASHFDLLDHYLTPGGQGVAAAALTGTLLVLLRISSTVVAILVRAHRGRARQHESLALVGTPHPDGYTVLDHLAPLVYCLPGRGGTVVVTAAALTTLTPMELASVLAHERRHLTGRHDLPLVLTSALAQTFRPLPFFTIAHAEVSALLEMQADDAVRDGPRRHAMATALVTLSVSSQKSAVAARVRRLLTTSARSRHGRRLSAGVVAMSLLAAPVALAMVPALEAAARDCCHVAQVHEPLSPPSGASPTSVSS